MSLFKTFWMRALLLLLVIALIIAGVLWIERIAIARRFADGELAVRKVKATYEITQISPKTQRIEHLVIGDPANPDLVADWVEIDVALRWMATDVIAVRAGGVRLKGHYDNNRFAFGEFDKLLPKSNGEPFALPDMNVAVSNSRIDLGTTYGAISAVVNGKGNLADGFSSKVVSTVTSGRFGACTVTGAVGHNELMVRQRKFLIGGTFTLGEARCGGAVASELLLSPEITIPENFGRWEGKLFAQAGDVKAAGYHARPGTFRGKPLTYAVSGSGNFKGDFTQTSGSLSLLTNALSGPMLADGAFSLRSGFVTSPDKGTFALSQGEIASPRFVIAPAALDVLRQISTRADRTPLESLGRGLGAALINATRVNSGSASFDASYAGGRGSLSARNFRIDGPNGFALKARPRDALVVNLSSGRFSLDGLVSVTGNGALPRGAISIAADQQGARGEARLLPLVAGDTRLALAPIVFAYRRARWSLDSVARFDGAIAGGRVSGLQLPLSIKNGALATPCLPVSFDQLALRGITLARAQVGLCLSGDRVALGPTNLAASLGSTPLILSAAQTSFGLRKQDFVLSDVTAKLGVGTSASLIHAARFNGVVAGSGASGQFEKAEATIGTVPLLLNEIGGNWRFSDDVLTLGGALRVADRDAVPRFSPLLSKDVVLRLDNQKISANATLQTPDTGISIARVTLGHDLRAEAGQADLTVAGINFGQSLQPEALTPITLGKVANVFGTVRGAGTIKWTTKGVTSTGGFRTDGLNFAAAFGPVTGLKGEISLSDLLGLETPAGQRVTIGAINPGILVQDGVVSYRLLPGLKVQIEGGRWPFSGGGLILEPTTLDLSESAVRNLTFRVEGLDAAKFINQLEFENIAATGIFDGVLPMVFDKNGGRIVGGRLIARSGGTLSYVGEVSKENLGFMGQFAFDALKSMKYDRLAIDLGGAIDGDIVTKVSFAGVNQLPITPQRTRFPIPIRGIDNIRFVFNVTITAPFRQLFETTRSLQDPSILIQRIVPQLQPTTPTPPVQP